jgi:hypothetical protein
MLRNCSYRERKGFVFVVFLISLSSLTFIKREARTGLIRSATKSEADREMISVFGK